MGNTVDLPQGALEMLILKASSPERLRSVSGVPPGRLHGYGILLRIQQISGER
jgi:PadR family transcriptional regulator, regulatory protein PadR